MAETITAFYSFTSTGKANSSDVNTNFSNFRGSQLPIAENTATASDNTYDLGTSDYRFRNLYLSNNIYHSNSSYGFVPCGTVIPFFLLTAPVGWIACDGSSVSRETYSDLFYFLTNGNETLPCFGFETTTNFNLPDLRGKFLRGVDNGAGNDPDATTTSRTAQGTSGSTGDSIGSIQPYATQNDFGIGNTYSTSHTHTIEEGLNITSGSDFPNGTPDSAALTTTGYTTGSSGDHSHTFSYNNETRPVNVYLNYFIRY